MGVKKYRNRTWILVGDLSLNREYNLYETIKKRTDGDNVTKVIYQLNHVIKTYQDGENQSFNVLDIEGFTCLEGEFIAIVGESGSGKSTLLNVLGVLDGFQSGKVKLAGKSIGELSDKEKARLRSQKIGFVLQNFGLVDDFTVKENIMLPVSYLPKTERKACRERLDDLAEELGITALLKKLPKKLSGGQKQRVAIARALINDPDIILADEPTGNLDVVNSEQVMLILKAKQLEGKTILLVTHDEQSAQRCDRVVRLVDGKIQ